MRMKNADCKYGDGDMVSFKFSDTTKEMFTGIIIGHHYTKSNKVVVYEIASMNHSMSKFSIGEKCILKKLS